MTNYWPTLGWHLNDLFKNYFLSAQWHQIGPWYRGKIDNGHKNPLIYASSKIFVGLLGVKKQMKHDCTVDKCPPLGIIVYVNYWESTLVVMPVKHIF